MLTVATIGRMANHGRSNMGVVAPCAPSTTLENLTFLSFYFLLLSNSVSFTSGTPGPMPTQSCTIFCALLSQTCER